MMNILLEPGARPVIGHRGNRAHAPENTIESFAQAVALGADAIEFDVHLTADGIPVVHHDPTVNRTTDGTGEIARMTFAQLREFDAGARFTSDAGKTYPYRGKGHRIPTFDEVVEAFPSTPLLIEIKAPLAATGVRASLEAHRAESRALVDAMDGRAVKVFADSGIPVGAARNDVARLMREVLLDRPITPFDFRALCVPLAYYGLPLPVRRFAKIAKSRNCRVHIWTVNDPAVAKKLWSWGIDGIISDDPALMLEARAGLPVVVA
ncbi:MAG TPA: glycerophosphodiester phosphodiesterase [Gemmatimonadaceae bacterium]|nr:glycerophosphodiester phosphodiesterase [Gemmatimonadaceae bacterium]